MSDFFSDLLRFLRGRLVIIFCVFTLCFLALVRRLFDLQIVNGEEYARGLRETSSQKLELKAPRGTIYDKFGRPLAVNSTSYTLKLNPSASFDYGKLNDALYDLMNLFERNGEKYIDEFPISKDEPYTFNFAGSETREKRWRADMNIDSKNKTAAEAFAQLREDFGVDPALSNDEARKIVSLRSAMYMKRYSQYSAITLAADVSDATMAVIEEESDKYAGIYVDTDSVRRYPAGVTFSHIIGYIGSANDTDLSRLEGLGYKSGDQVGKAGLEQSLESDLRGISGSREVEVDSATGRVLSVLDSGQGSVPGDKFFLTIDSRFQEQAYEILKDKLTEILINRLTVSTRRDSAVSAREALASLIKTGAVSVRKIWRSEPDSYSYDLRQCVLEEWPDADVTTPDGATQAREILSAAILRGRVPMGRVFLVMYEQGLITADAAAVSRLEGGGVSMLQFLVNKIKAGEITPQMVNIDPSSGSVVVVDARSGAVLAAASYPTYDNAAMTANFNEYFPVINEDITAPSYFRAFQERRAPGSTFKMITAVTGLEKGVITPSSTIRDETTFKKAGIPYLRCWSSASHGSINVVRALQVSCNYFFCETAYRLGNSKNGNMKEGIASLNEYMKAFGLNERTGVEIGEAYDTRESGAEQISSPEYRKYLGKLYGTNEDWYDGDTVATAIGQAINNYTAASMAKVASILANGGTRYKMHLTSRQESWDETLKKEAAPVIEETVSLKQSTWSTVYSGMYNVTHAPGATGYNTFKGFPVSVGGKTGTAQENKSRHDHTSFLGFAPFDDPRIAVYTVIPFGDTQATPTAAGHVARDVIGAYMGIGSKPAPESPPKANSLVK
ncbi:MAG: hypothetical protein LBU36_02195 [Clostridiales bacterium]|jgi:cell division protein FtsI/penicillin-binding protein 2|nr:hypothetical protein [Clostridiales bacterium]